MKLKITCEKTSEPDLSNAVFEIVISFLAIKIHTSKKNTHKGRFSNNHLEIREGSQITT